jgi:Protein of unknown function (DUF4231)
MTPEEYITKRLEDQYEYYEGKSIRYQKRYYFLRTVEIIAAALIPFLSGLIIGFPEYRQTGTITIGILGMLVTIIAGMLSLRRYQENWIEYRKGAESLKRERFIFETQTPPYDKDNRFSVFVQNIELILGKENANWSQNMLKALEPPKPPPVIPPPPPKPPDAPKPPTPPPSTTPTT